MTTEIDAYTAAWRRIHRPPKSEQPKSPPLTPAELGRLGGCARSKEARLSERIKLRGKSMEGKGEI